LHACRSTLEDPQQAAFESGIDITAGAELRRVGHLLDIANTLPAWQRPQYLMERLPQSLLSPDLQRTRIDAIQRVWNRDPQAFVERFVPMFLSGLTRDFNGKKSQSRTPSAASAASN
jgi:hypothetical protein